MIAKLIRMARRDNRIAGLRDSIYALTRYVVDADPWAMAMIDREHVRSLTEYLTDVKAHGIEPGEKAGHIGQRNLLGEELAGQQTEMLAVASSAPRVEYPVIHIIVSWHADERPSDGEINDTVETVLAITGLSACPAIFAEHTNTSHPHLHIAVVRIDPATGLAAGSEWLIEDLHQAVAILEERHQWAAEPNAIYYARGGAVFDPNTRRCKKGANAEVVVDPASEIMVRDSAGRFIRHRDRRALPSDLLNLRASILRARAEAKGWADFHRLLEVYEVSYRAKGSGARLHFGKISSKASALAPDLALTQLVKQWGPYTMSPRDRVMGFEKYRAAHMAQLKRLRDDRAAAQAVLDTWASDRLAEVTFATNRRVERAIRLERDAAQKELNTVFATAITTCIQSRLTTAEKWREADAPVEPPPVVSPTVLLPANPTSERRWQPPAGLRADHEQWCTRYYDEANRLVFTDHHALIVVHQPSEIDAIDAALKLAAERWGTVKVTGSDEFKKLSAERAGELGIALVDSENRPLVVDRPFARSTPIKSQKTPAVRPSVPSRRTDPARDAALARVSADLARMGTIPLRRRVSPGVDKANSRLEIVVEADRFDPKPSLEFAAMFDEDATIQAFLERHRKMALGNIGRQLLHSETPLDRKAVVASLRGQDGLGRAAFLAFEDPDFQSMLQRVALERADRKRRAEHSDLIKRRDREQQRSRLAVLARLFHDRTWDPREWHHHREDARENDRVLADDERLRLELLRHAGSSNDRSR